jgi:hypothetical protein
MTDIAVFKKMLDQRPYSTVRGYVYLAAQEVRPGQFAYRVGFKSWPTIIPGGNSADRARHDLR